jgi:signal transduction histidine kinase
MFARTLRGRLLIWLAFLLACILSGFAGTAYQLHRLNLLQRVDEELDRRVANLSAEVRDFGPGPMGGPRRDRDRDRGPDGPQLDGPGQEIHLSEPPGPGPTGSKPPGSGPPMSGPPGFGPLRDFPGRPGPREFGARNRKIEISPETMALFNEADTNGFYFVFWNRDGKVLRQSTNAPAGLESPDRPGNDTSIHHETRDAGREAWHFTEMGECALVGRSLTVDWANSRRFGWGLALAGFAVLALGLGSGWWLVSRAIRPVEDISASASRISAGNLAERIPVKDEGSELGRLASVLNSTFARLDAAFAQQKQFTADASHELRTPLAVVIAETQATLARERSPAEYRETVQTCLDTAQEMRRLTESLLQLARFDAGQEVMNRQPFDLAEVARTAVERIRPLAQDRGLKLVCETVPANVRGDADRLQQVVTNLLANAIHYNRTNGEVHVSIASDQTGVVLIVRDTGPGIPPDDLPHIFERFYRSDKSRTHSHGRSGSGLGLAICKAIVDAHAGAIGFACPKGGGTTVTVRLPTDHDSR